jgi:pilus assembly protein CpaE
VVNYRNLHIITAPADLRYTPQVSAEAIADLINTLKRTYDNVIIDLPHVWTPWVVAALQQATHVVLVAQLWLKSVSHASRMLRVIRDLNIPGDAIYTVINRSGARFKEAIEPKDFSRVCGAPIRYTLVNDIKTVVNAEAAARTILEMEPSELATDIQTLARGLLGHKTDAGTGTKSGRSGLFARLKG